MNIFSVILALFCLTVAPESFGRETKLVPPPRPRKVETDFHRLEGTWNIVNCELNGASTDLSKLPGTIPNPDGSYSVTVKYNSAEQFLEQAGFLYADFRNINKAEQFIPDIRSHGFVGEPVLHTEVAYTTSDGIYAEHSFCDTTWLRRRKCKNDTTIRRAYTLDLKGETMHVNGWSLYELQPDPSLGVLECTATRLRAR